MSRRDKPSKDVGTPPSLEWIELDRLVVDRRYQRVLGEKNERHIKRITANFNWRHYQPIIVTESDDKYAVIDGQHRLQAARKHPQIDALPCYVVEAATVADQAAIFIAANTQRIGIGRIHQFWAAHAAGADWAVRIHRLCSEAGIEISRTPRSNLPAGVTVATFTIQKLFPLGDEAIGAALSLLMETQRKTPDVLRSSNIAALARIAAGDTFDRAGTKSVLRGLDLAVELGRAKAARATGGGSLEAAMEKILRRYLGRRAA